MKLKKSTIIGLCICSIFSLLIPGVIAANSEKMDSSTVASTNEYGTFKNAVYPKRRNLESIYDSQG